MSEEIKRARKKMEDTYFRKGKITPEVLKMSRELDQKILHYLRLVQ